MFKFVILAIIAAIIIFVCYSAHADHVERSNMQKEKEKFLNACLTEAEKRFGISFEKYKRDGKRPCDSSIDHNFYLKTSNAKYSIYVNMRVRRAVLTVQHYQNVIFTGADVYMKSNGGEYRHCQKYTRREYIEIMERHGYRFNTCSDREKYYGRYASREAMESLESFIGDHQFLLVKEWETEDFADDFTLS